MQTRKALEKLSKGDKKYNDRADGLGRHRDRFLEMFEEREREIVAKLQRNEIQLPFVEALKRKVAKVVDGPNANLPVVTRFDLYQGIRKISERAPTDSGLKRLAIQLERAWHSEPLGALSYGDVSGLVAVYRDQYPRSKAADAIEAECTRVGMHKLPVAKLVRIASNINTQEDYDSAMQIHGYAGDRPEQVRARTLVRELIAMRGGAVDSHVEQVDTRDLSQRLVDRVTREASLQKEAGYQEAMSILTNASSLGSQLVGLIDKASVEMHADGLESLGRQLHTMGQALERWLGSLTDTQDQAQPMSQEVVDKAVPSAPEPESMVDDLGDAPPSDAVPAAPSEAPASPAKKTNPWDDDPVLRQDMEEAGMLRKPKGPKDPQLDQDMQDAGMKKKWYDPRTWFMQSAELQRLAKMAAELGVATDGDVSDALLHFAKFANKANVRIAQLVEDKDEAHDMAIVEDQMHDLMPPDDDMPMADMMGPADVQEQDVQMGQDIVHEISDQAQEIIQQAPPEAMDYIDHEMAEGHTAPPGTAEWGAEEILNEGHDAPPPSEQWLQEELAELGLLDTPLDAGPGDMQASGIIQGLPMAAAKGKGIPLPDGEIDDQPNAKNALDCVPEDGAKALKASQIEDALLSGRSVRVGSTSLHINDKNEIELWHKNAGRACDLFDMDLAIADFMNIVAEERRVAASSKVRFAYRLTPLVSVPCDMCASVNMFPVAKVASDEYACDCGNLIKAASVNALMKVAQMQKAYQLQVAWRPVADPQQAKVQRDRIMRTVSTLPNVKIDDEGRGFLTATVWNTDEHSLAKLEKQMVALGGQPETRRVAGKKCDVCLKPLSPNLSGKTCAKCLNSKKAQMAPPAPAVPAPGGPPAPAQSGQQSGQADGMPATNAPMKEVMMHAMANYKNQGMDMPKALRTFFKEHGDTVEQRWGHDDAGTLVSILQEMFTNADVPSINQPGVDSPAPQMQGQPMPVAAFKEPAIRKPKDHVKVPDNVLGKDMEGKDLIPSPGKIKQQQGKPDGKLSDTNLGPDSESKEWNEPSTAKSSPNKAKLPNTDLGKDTEGNEPFKTPALGK